MHPVRNQFKSMFNYFTLPVLIFIFMYTITLKGIKEGKRLIDSTVIPYKL